MIFETRRLVVRPLLPNDFDAYFQMQGNSNVHRFTCSPTDDEATARAGLRKHIQAYSQPNNRWWIWCVEEKSTATMVGTCAIVDGENEIVGAGPEIGYRFLERYWGNGFAKEICGPLVRHALQTMQLPSVFATVDVENVASVKVLEQSPLRFVAEYFNGTDNCTDRVYQLDRAQWVDDSVGM